MGSSLAYHLKSDRNFTGEVVVVERDPAYAQASSALSASVMPKRSRSNSSRGRNVTLFPIVGHCASAT